MWSDALTDAREYGIAATDGKAINGKCTFPPRDKRDLFFFTAPNAVVVVVVELR